MSQLLSNLNLAVYKNRQNCIKLLKDFAQDERKFNYLAMILIYEMDGLQQETNSMKLNSQNSNINLGSMKVYLNLRDFEDGELLALLLSQKVYDLDKTKKHKMMQREVLTVNDYLSNDIYSYILICILFISFHNSMFLL